ncbi:MAG: DUF1559 domain-containing protein [Planctomycetaceae bacterium]|nr:DUF1559 domain-containing protein [Planctomycetaceae bacterium]
MTPNPDSQVDSTIPVSESDRIIRSGDRISLILIGVLFAGIASTAVYSSSFSPEARRARCCARMEQLLLAMDQYHVDYGSFPPACTVDREGRPLHSWRTLLLPYLNQSSLYHQIDLTRPWNAPENSRAFQTAMPLFQCPCARLGHNQSTYLVLNGPDCIFNADKTMQIRQITDGTANTIAIVDVPESMAIPWMQPVDLSPDMLPSIKRMEDLSHSGGLIAGFACGKSHFIDSGIDDNTLRHLSTAAGGEGCNCAANF